MKNKLLPNRKNLIRLAAIAAVALLFVGCGGLTPEQKVSLMEFAQAELDAGRMTQGQYQAFVDALGGGTNWLLNVGEHLLDIGLAYFGINFMRDRGRRRRGEATGSVGTGTNPGGA